MSNEEKAFVNAAACGDLADIKVMLGKESTTAKVINGVDKDGRTALHYACLNDDINLLPLLLADKRVNLMQTTPNDEGIFHLAALYSSMQAIGMLVLNKEALKMINAVNKFGETPLHLCAGTGNKKSGKTAELLLNNGADVTIVDKWKRGPVDVAFNNGHNWLSDLILEFVGKMSPEIQEKVKNISEKMKKDQEKVVEFNKEAVENKKQFKNMFSGGFNVKLKKTETVEKQIFSSTQGKIVNNDKTRHVTKVSGKVLSKLIDFPGDREEITKLAKDPEVNVAGKDSFGLTALHKFASWNKPELIELILPQLSPEQLNEQDLEGKTALHWACEMASVGTVSFLIKQGVDKNIKDKKGRTPLDILNTGEGDVINRLKKALNES